jgi:hypothetical protein
MDSQTGTKINRLLKVWPPGTVAVSSWLKDLGISPQLAHRYEQSGWIRRIGQGAFVRQGEIVDWSGAVWALQQGLNLPVHVGGKTALDYHGLSHFLPMSSNPSVSLFGRKNRKLPSWFVKGEWAGQMVYRMDSMFSDASGLTDKDMGGFAIRMASPERAMLEVLSGVPQVHSYEEAKLLMDGLVTLRPGLVQALLQQCRSIKAKRLFLFLSEVQGHSWRKSLNPGRVDLGSGNRVIVKGGKLDPVYMIVVPDRREELKQE